MANWGLGLWQLWGGVLLRWLLPIWIWTESGVNKEWSKHEIILTLQRVDNEEDDSKEMVTPKKKKSRKRRNIKKNVMFKLPDINHK